MSLIFPVTAYAVPDNSAKAVILIHANAVQVLNGKNTDSYMLIARTTNIMTALIDLEHCSQDVQVTIFFKYTTVESSSMYLKAGESYTVRDILYCMVLY